MQISNPTHKPSQVYPPGERYSAPQHKAKPQKMLKSPLFILWLCEERGRLITVMFPLIQGPPLAGQWQLLGSEPSSTTYWEAHGHTTLSFLPSVLLIRQTELVIVLPHGVVNDSNPLSIRTTPDSTR